MNKAELKDILKISLIASSPLLLIAMISKPLQSVLGALAVFFYVFTQRVAAHYRQKDGIPSSNAIGNSSDDDSSWTHAPHTAQNMINPSTGLPMIGGIGGTDLHGNSFGSSLSESSSWTSSSHDSQTFINPASSLPMMGGIGGTDLHGNTYGSNTNNW